MKFNTEMHTAITMLSKVTAIEHLYSSTLKDRWFGGVVHYILVVSNRRFLVWQDDETYEVVVNPFSLWDDGNLADNAEGMHEIVWDSQDKNMESNIRNILNGKHRKWRKKVRFESTQKK